MPDVYDRPQCPLGCRGVLIGTCRIDGATITGRLTGNWKAGHESLFPARSITDLVAVQWMRKEFLSIVRRLREVSVSVTAFTVDASWRMIRPEFG